MDAKELGRFIAELRKENNITQVELARKLNVTDKAVSRWERGLGFPDINTLEPLAEALGISLVELMQSKRKVPNESISSEKVEELLLNTIQLSKEHNSLLRMIGFAVLAVFLVVAIVVLSVLFKDWNSVNYIAASIIVGLTAWGIPVWKMTISANKQVIVSSVSSFSCALIAIVFNIIDMAHNVHINDMVAIIDTIDVVVTEVCIFIVITIVMNIIMINRSKRILKGR